VIVNGVELILENMFLGDLADDLIHGSVRHVHSHGLQDEGVGSAELQVTELPGGHFSQQNRPGQVRDHHTGESVDESDDREPDENHPPHPEDEEVLLVEDVVVKDAEIVAGVNTTSSGTNSDVARDLSREELTHGVVGEIFSVSTDVLLRPDVLEHFLSVAEELVEEEGVSDEHGEEAHQQVEELTESKVEVISCKSRPEVREVGGDLSWVRSGSDDVLEHPSLQHVPPQRSGHLGEPEAEGEEEGEPEIVGSDGSVSRRLQLGLVNKATSGLPLEVFLHIGSAVDPAVGPCILVTTLADNGTAVKMILQEYKEETKHHDEGCGLVMQLKQRIVDGKLVPLEPFEKVAHEGETVYNCRSHGWTSDGLSWSNLR